MNRPRIARSARLRIAGTFGSAPTSAMDTRLPDFENMCQPSVLISHRLVVSLGRGRPPQRAAQRQNRERELIAATRALFDERGVQDAPIEEIAKSVGIARGLIYRQFSSKEELYVATVADYLTELARRARRRRGRGRADDPVDRLERMAVRVRRLLRALPRLPRLRARDHAAPGRRAERDRLRGDLASAWPGDGRLHRPRRPHPPRRERDRRLRGRGPRLHREHAVDADARRDAPRPDPGRHEARPRAACPSSSGSRPNRSCEACVESALATVRAS